MPLVHQSYLFMGMNACVLKKKIKKAFIYPFAVHKYTGKRLGKNLNKHLKRVRVQFWNDTTMGYRNNRNLGKRTTYHSAEMLQLLENLLQINDKFHWFSFFLEHRKLSCALAAKINFPSPGPVMGWHRNTVNYMQEEEKNKLVSLFQSAN